MRTGRRTGGLALMVVAAVGAMLLAGPAVAQDAEQVDVTVQRHALLAFPINDVVPDTLTGAFPPQVVCLVAPELCPESLEPVREGVGGVLKEVDENPETSPLQPVNPDTLTVEYMGGTARYASGMLFELPDIPEGEEYDEFVLRFPETDLTFDYDSPKFRRAVFAAVATAGESDDRAGVFQEQLTKLLTDDEEAVVRANEEKPLLGIEACPLTKEVPDGAEPPQSKPIRSVEEDVAVDDDPNDNEEPEPEWQLAVNCLYGANGSFDGESWSFDLTLAAKSWANGTLEDNHGILLRPTGAPNLAFGDPDLSTNARVTMDISEPPTATVASSEPPPPVEPLGDGFSLPSGDTTSGTSSQPPLSSGTSGGGLSSMPSTTPQTAPPAQVADPQTTPQDQPVAAPPSEPASSPVMPWHVWLLVPVFAAGIWLTATSLTAGVAVATTRHGALSRLTGGAA